MFYDAIGCISFWHHPRPVCGTEEGNCFELFRCVRRVGYESLQGWTKPGTERRASGSEKAKSSSCCMERRACNVVWHGMVWYGMDIYMDAKRLR